MSDDQPTEPTVPFEPNAPGVAGTSEQFETVGPAGGGGGSRRLPVIASVAAVVALVLAGGAYAAWSYLDGGGPQPEDVLPASTIAVVSVDLDPSASQKIAAIKSIRKFPALKESLGLNADDDLREYIFDKVLEGTDCTGIDFADDIKPWLGKRAAFAAVEVGGEPAPVIAVQVSDPGDAKAGFDEIVDCADPDDFAFVVGEDYLIASDSAEHAKAVLAGGQKKALADDAAYQRWTDEVGDAGVMNFYIGAKATDFVDDLFSDFAGDSDFATSSEFSEGPTIGSSAPVRPADDDPGDAFADVVKDFKGLAGSVRFAGGGMELAMASGGLSQYSGDARVGDDVAALPDDTAIALGIGIPDDFAELIVDGLGSSSDDLVTEAEQETGMDLPEDLQTLLGEAVTVSLGGDVPDSPDAIEDLGNVPAGVLVHGDADRIEEIVAKIEDHLGMSLSDIPLVLESSGDKVALATSKEYAEQLLDSGDLGSEDGFRDVVPEARKASQVVYLDFDSPWREFLTDLVAEEDGGEADDNTRPLKSFGISSWQDGEVSHQLVKVTTD